jgi:hypothetical protein
MCPACIASAAWMAGSVMSTGGVAALAVKMVRKKSGSQENSKNETERRNDNGNNDSEQNRPSTRGDDR